MNIKFYTRLNSAIFRMVQENTRKHYEEAYNLIGEEGNCAQLVDLHKLAFNELYQDLTDF